MTDQIFYTEGAQNTFFLTFSKKHNLAKLTALAIEKEIRPDGFIFCTQVSKSVFDFDFYNNDGGRVDFCGNALRAVGKCVQKVFSLNQLTLNTKVGCHEIKVLEGGKVVAQMPEPVLKKQDVDILNFKVPYIVSGVPHLVFATKKLNLDFKNREELREFCHKVRKLDLKEKMQTFNLSFYKESTGLHEPVPCVTFERGVEDFTQACGSGALSVAYVLSQGNFQSEIQIKMPGGLLQVFKKQDKIYMQGEASIINTFEV